MFEGALLDSSPARAPVLMARHYLISASVAGLVSVAALCVLPRLVFVPPHQGLFASAVLGGACGLWALMVCYVAADARQLGLCAAVWVGLTLVLNLPGFVLYLICSAARRGDWKRAAIPLAYMLQGALLGLLILYPLLRIEALPKVWSTLEVPSPPAPAGPPPATRALRSVSRQRVSLKALLETPPSIPKTIAHVQEAPLPPDEVSESGPWVPGGIPGAPGDGIPGGILGSIGSGTAGPPPPPARAKAIPPKMIRVGGNVIAAKAIYQPTPDYPPLAKMARIQGTVRLQAIIGKDGTVQDLKALSGHPWLVRAAIEAVQHWRYQPTLLNGEPVDVLTEIEVNFRLAE